jgi:hypothetical protein
MPQHRICQRPNNPNAPLSKHPFSLGLYMDDFVNFSEDLAVEDLFCHLLGERCKVDFMGFVEWFLGVHFLVAHLLIGWFCPHESIGLCFQLHQKLFFVRHAMKNPLQPCTGLVFLGDSIAPSTNAYNFPAQLRQTQAYQSLIGSIGWLATTTQSDLTAIHFFLSSYSTKPAVGHMSTSLYSLNIQFWHHLHFRQHCTNLLVHSLSFLHRHLSLYQCNTSKTFHHLHHLGLQQCMLGFSDWKCGRRRPPSTSL